MFGIKDGKKVELTQLDKEQLAQDEGNTFKLEWREKRCAEYPSFEEVVHAILDDNMEAIQIRRNAIKLKYPKTEAEA